MNTLFRVLYTAAMQWRTLLMYCGPQGEAAYCWSPLGREMVRLMIMMMMMMMMMLMSLITRLSNSIRCYTDLEATQVDATHLQLYYTYY